MNGCLVEHVGIIIGEGTWQ